MSILINPKRKKRIKKNNNSLWLITSSALLAGFMIFIAVSATRSSELELPQSLVFGDYEEFLSQKTINFTEEFTNELALQILGNLNPDATSSLEEVVLGYLNEFGIDDTSLAAPGTEVIFGVEIKDEDILISEDNSEKAMISYFSQLSSIISQTKQDLREKFNGSSGADLNLYTEAADTYAKAFVATKKLIAPSFWKDVHKKELELMAEAKKVFEALSLVNQDPVKSWWAVQHYLVLNTEGLQLEKDIKAKGTELINSFK